MKFLNPKFLITELIKEEEYIIIFKNHKNKIKIKKEKLKEIKVENRKEAEVFFEKSKFKFDISDTIDCIENNIKERTIIFKKDEINKNVYIEIIIQEVMNNLKKDDKNYLKKIEEFIKKIKYFIK